MGRPIVVVFAALWLSACVTTSFTVDQSMAVACRGYSGTLFALSAFKSDMSEEQTSSVNTANDFVIPACEQAAAGEIEDPEAVLNRIRLELRKLLILEKELQS